MNDKDQIFFSDALDWYLARRTGTESAIGETLDSIEDFTMIIILLILIVPIINPSMVILIWIGIIGILRNVTHDHLREV
ncbi:MAG: CDP-alcohol phosphatidyltransferase family protein [archaeon]